MVSGFIDHYEVLGAGLDPDTPQEELRRVYFELIRQYHPDKRPGSAGDTGQRMTQGLNLAYETLSDSARREAYDAVWRGEKEAALPPQKRSDMYRRKGNELYSQARDLVKGSADQFANMRGVQASVKLYSAAMAEYAKALESVPNDHRLYSNRALCYLAVEDWGRCREDAQTCIGLRPDFMKGYFLLVKALWSLGMQNEAFQELQNGLHAVPGSRDLLDLQASLVAGQDGGRSPSGHSVSPACTPPVSRSNTPTRLYSQTMQPNPQAVRRSNSSRSPVGHRPVSPPLVAAGAMSAGGSRGGRSPGPAGAQTFGGCGGPPLIPTGSGGSKSSRSPGARSRQGGEQPPPPPRPPPGVAAAPGMGVQSLDGSFTVGTGNFGAPTPSFAAGQASFPPSASAMWGDAGQSRGSRSPGPNRVTSTSPGPSFNSAGASFGGRGSTPPPPPPGAPGSRNNSRERKSTSLRGLANSGRGLSPTAA